MLNRKLAGIVVAGLLFGAGAAQAAPVDATHHIADFVLADVRNVPQTGVVTAASFPPAAEIAESYWTGEWMAQMIASGYTYESLGFAFPASAD